MHLLKPFFCTMILSNTGSSEVWGFRRPCAELRASMHIKLTFVHSLPCKEHNISDGKAFLASAELPQSFRRACPSVPACLSLHSTHQPSATSYIFDVFSPQKMTHKLPRSFCIHHLHPFTLTSAAFGFRGVKRLFSDNPHMTWQLIEASCETLPKMLGSGPMMLQMRLQIPHARH